MAPKVNFHIGEKIMTMMNTSETKVPPIPKSVEKAIIQNNKLEELPELPQSLVNFSCPTNNLSELPKLPANLGNLILLRE